jgi:hypothetical protein
MTIYEVKKRLESYGYVFSHMYYSPTKRSHHFQLLKSPKNDYPRDISYAEMRKLLEAEEKIRLRSERIENILSHGY